MHPPSNPTDGPARPTEFDTILFALGHASTDEAGVRLAAMDDATAAEVLVHLNQARARELIDSLPADRSVAIIAAAPEGYRELWTAGAPRTPNSVGELMRPPIGILPSYTQREEAIEELRRLTARDQVTYLYATDADGRLAGVVVLRDLFLKSEARTLAEVMITPPFYLTPDMPVLDAMRATVSRHYPVYPVCDVERRVIGLVRGQALFEKQAFMISAQQGSLVGLRATESLSTPWRLSLRYRHPWLQFSLVAGLLPALVVATFQGTIARLVVLAVFAPLVAHQARNSGAQTMAITLRSFNTGEWLDGQHWRVIARESFLATVNGAIIGLLAGLLMALLARQSGREPAGFVAVMTISMALSCAIGAAFGVITPLGLRRFRADPAHASTIVYSAFVTCVSQAVFLGLAAWLL